MDKLKEYLTRHRAELDVDKPAGQAWENIEGKLSAGSTETGISLPAAFPTRSGLSKRLIRYSVAACLIALAGIGLWLIVKKDPPHPDTAKQGSMVEKKEPPPAQRSIDDSLSKPAIATDAVRDKDLVQKDPAQKDLVQKDLAQKDMVQNVGKPIQARHKAGIRKTDDASDEVDRIGRSYTGLINWQLKKLRATPLYAEDGSYFSFYTEQFRQMEQDEQAVRNAIKTYGLTNEFLEQLINVYQQKLNILKNLQSEINKMNNKVRGKQSPSVNPEVHYLSI